MSSTRPLLFLADLVPSLDPALVAKDRIEDLVSHGLDHLFTMQTPEGGFSFWPGGTEPHVWGSANAVQLLLDAQKHGFPVPQDRLDSAVKYLADTAASLESGNLRSHEWSELGDGDPEPYVQFVLALVGKADKGRVQKLIDLLPPNPTGESAEELYTLQAALYLSGDRRYESALKRPDVSSLSDWRSNRWSFYSDRRRRGFMLSTFVDLFGQDPAGEPLAQLVAAGLRGHQDGWYTTEELVWGITGLGKWVSGEAASFSPPELLVDGRRLAPRPTPATTKSSDRVWAVARASEYKSVDVRVPAKGQGKLYLMLSSEGVRADQSFQEGGEGLRVSRSWLNQDGTPLDFGKHALGDLVFVQIELSNRSGERVDNVALVDRFPAGWEIENARLGRGGLTADWISDDDLWKADYVNLRDDHVEYFGSLGRGETRKVVYLLRAVTAGHFDVPPVEAAAMYDPRLWARSGQQSLDIAGPWAPYLD
ncbi:MAG: alpha-2-macroglobulin family protein [Myxococcales bacterium]